MSATMDPRARPIVMDAEYVRALLDGRKTQTRRVMKPQPSEDWLPDSYGEVHGMTDGEPDPDKVIGWGPCSWDGEEAHRCPYGRPGDQLWLRESWAPASDRIWYRATDPPNAPPLGWKSPIFMPRRYSRITLEITDIEAEPLQEIADPEAVWAEGVPRRSDGEDENAAVDDFAAAWDRINVRRGWGWESNPWVWVLTVAVR